jgi:hypothetical protein
MAASGTENNYNPDLLIQVSSHLAAVAFCEKLKIKFLA